MSEFGALPGVIPRSQCGCVQVDGLLSLEGASLVLKSLTPNPRLSLHFFKFCSSRIPNFHPDSFTNNHQTDLLKAVEIVERDSLAIAQSFTSLYDSLRLALSESTSSTNDHMDCLRFAAGRIQESAIEASSKGNHFVNSCLSWLLRVDPEDVAVVDEMDKAGVRGSISTVNILVGALGAARVERCLQLVQKWGLKMNAYTFKCILQSHLRSYQSDKAYGVYLEMSRKGYKLDIYA